MTAGRPATMQTCDCCGVSKRRKQEFTHSRGTVSTTCKDCSLAARLKPKTPINKRIPMREHISGHMRHGGVYCVNQLAAEIGAPRATVQHAMVELLRDGDVQVTQHPLAWVTASTKFYRKAAMIRPLQTKLKTRWLTPDKKYPQPPTFTPIGGGFGVNTIDICPQNAPTIPRPPPGSIPAPGTI